MPGLLKTQNVENATQETCVITWLACKLDPLAHSLHSACTALAQHLGKASVLFGLLLGRLWAPPPPSLCTHDLKDMLLDANGAMFEMDPVANTFRGACTALAKRLRSRRPCLAHCLASCTTFCASNTNATQMNWIRVSGKAHRAAMERNTGR